MKHDVPCRCCGDIVHQVTLRFDSEIGYTCTECNEGLKVAEEVLEIAGCAGIHEKPKVP